ncbi:MAG: hypothetical protein HY074_10265 [Deltaproteobacteria bacterium]|nr:hypothetical protein [Deltaproteobacteria bacterium]
MPATVWSALLFGLYLLAPAQAQQFDASLATGFAGLCAEVCRKDVATCQNELRQGELTIYSQLVMDSLRDKGLLKSGNSAIIRVEVLDLKFDVAALKCTGELRYFTDKATNGVVKTSALAPFSPEVTHAKLHSCFAGLWGLSQGNFSISGELALRLLEKNGKLGVYAMSSSASYFGVLPAEILNTVFASKQKQATLQAGHVELEKKIAQAKDDEKKAGLERELAKLDNLIRSEALAAARAQSKRYGFKLEVAKFAPVMVAFEVHEGVPEIILLDPGTPPIPLVATEVSGADVNAVIRKEVVERLGRLTPDKRLLLTPVLRGCATLSDDAIRVPALAELAKMQK